MPSNLPRWQEAYTLIHFPKLPPQSGQTLRLPLSQAPEGLGDILPSQKWADCGCRVRLGPEA